MKRVTNPELLRSVLSAAQGKQYWRSLEELANDPAFRAALEREFPDRASEWTDDLPSRRHFLALMGASLGLAGVSGCHYIQPDVKIVPYVKQPDNLVLGKPLYYATAMPLSGYGYGLLVESHEGRPTKVEGNPEHPASKGGTSAFAQASVLNLYDPDRSQSITNRGQTRTWGALIELLRTRLDRKESKQALAILTEAIASPTLAWQIAEFRRDNPTVKWALYEPTDLTGKAEGTRL
jgi:MoCo/4Fe-4S cofactor protein with predicted Tat translocation signal